MKRAHFKSKIGFIWSAVGSAVGLGSIWRFPYIVGQNGGAAFVVVFLFLLFFLALPVFIAEIIIGRKAQLNPRDAFRKIGKSRGWAMGGLLTIITGFIVCSFYSVISGWTLGYLIEIFTGSITHFSDLSQAQDYFKSNISSVSWVVLSHLIFMFISTIILYVGVQKGIEACNKVLMPILFILLIALVVKGLTLSGAMNGVKFVFEPDFSKITATTVIMALGQAFFGLSLGQGTMITYGSYLKDKDDVPSTCFPIALSVVIVSLLAGVAIFTAVFSEGGAVSSGTNLMFETLPLVFSKMTGGFVVALLFFFLIFLAGLTSQISAMEPMISYLGDKFRFKRHKSVALTGVFGFLLGVPSALSFNLMKDVTFFGMIFFDAISYLAINILVPIGGILSVILVGWRWGTSGALKHLYEGSSRFFQKSKWLSGYIMFSIKYLCPIVIAIIFLNMLGLF